MNDNAKAWVAALRSGKYKQGRLCLRREDDSFCCLGIACDLAVQAGVIEPPELDNREGEYEYREQAAVLPISVKDWLGLAGDEGEYGFRSLAEDNDAGLSFEEIADTIEREPEGLFA